MIDKDKLSKVKSEIERYEAAVPRHRRGRIRGWAMKLDDMTYWMGFLPGVICGWCLAHAFNLPTQTTRPMGRGSEAPAAFSAKEQ